MAGLKALPVVVLVLVVMLMVGSAFGKNKNFKNEKKIVTYDGRLLMVNGERQLLFSGSIHYPRSQPENSGAFMEKRFASSRAVTIQGLSAGTLDITLTIGATGFVGLKGEKEEVCTDGGVKQLNWILNIKLVPAATWYKTYFDTLERNDPVALRMNHMGKGMIWVNGKSFGRYWVNYLSPFGKPTQAEYHALRFFLKLEKNLLVIFEEETRVNLENIEVALVNRDTVCSFITEDHPPSVDPWDAKGGKFKAVVKDLKPGAQLHCPQGEVIEKVNFASFGNLEGFYERYSIGTCHSLDSKEIVEKACLGKSRCSVPFDKSIFEDKCPRTYKTLAIQVTCGTTPTEKVGEMEIPK